ncbi:MAG: VOC family protein [Pseudomonadota bacterium]
MVEQIFVNLPVADLDASTAFWRALGFDFDPNYTNDKAACLVLGPNIHAMLLTPGFFAGFTHKALADARTVTECITALQLGSRAAVDALLSKALAAGGSEPNAANDLGFMYQRTFEDPDGHIWEAFHLSAVSPAPRS